MNQRWKVSLHESAHAIAALALGGKCERLTIYHDNSGHASLSELSPFDLAVSRAAAAVAEETLADEPAPTVPEPHHARCEYRYPDSATVPLAVTAARIPRDSVTSDERAVAAFCILGLEDEPGRWAARYNVIRATAHRVVADHRQRILAVARALFARGNLSQNEIKEEFEK